MAGSDAESGNDDSSFAPEQFQRRFLNDVRELPQGAKRHIVTTYYVDTEEAAYRLASWFARRPDIEVTIKTILPTTQAQLDSAAQQGLDWVEVVRKKHYWVKLQGPPIGITPNDLREWGELLQQVPTDSAWRIGLWALRLVS